MGFTVLNVLKALFAGLSSFLSPCILPLVPVYLGIVAGGMQYLNAGDAITHRTVRTRVVLSTVLFVLGFTLLFALLGVPAALAGDLLEGKRQLLSQIGGLLIIVFGLIYLGWLRFPFMEKQHGGMTMMKTRYHYLNAFMFGVAFALVWSPCVGATMGSLIADITASKPGLVVAMVLMGLCGVGLGIPLIVFSLFSKSIMPVFQRAKRALPVFSSVMGGLLIAYGFMMNTGFLDRVQASGQELAASAVPAIPEAAGAVCGPDSPPGCAETVVGQTCDSGDAGCECTVVERKNVVLDFYSPRCTYCSKLKPILMDVYGACGDDVEIRAVNIATEIGAAEADRFGVGRAVPALIFLNASGSEITRIVGFQKRETLQQAFRSLTGRQCGGFRPIDVTEK